MKLTLKTYYTARNNYLTSSKIKDYLKDPYYFYQKHITHEIVETLDTPSVRIGSAADCYLTRGASVFNKTYSEKVTKKENPDLYEYQKLVPDNILTASEMERALAIIDNVKRTTLYKDIKKNFKKQVILQHDEPLGCFAGTAGALDFLKVDGNKAIIIDLKTTSDVSLPKFKYASLDLGYFLQQAMYQRLVRKNFPEVKVVESYILAVENNGPVYKTAFYRLDQNEIQFEQAKLSALIELIKHLKPSDYKPQDLTWDSAEEL